MTSTLCKPMEDVVTNYQEVIIPENEELYSKITNLLLELGYKPSNKGFHCLRTSLMLIITNPDNYQSMTKALYPTVAMIHSSTPSRVERAIRHETENVFLHGNYKLINQIVKHYNPEKDKPTNKELIFKICEYFAMHKDLSSEPKESADIDH